MARHRVVFAGLHPGRFFSIRIRQRKLLTSRVLFVILLGRPIRVVIRVAKSWKKNGAPLPGLACLSRGATVSVPHSLSPRRDTWLTISACELSVCMGVAALNGPLTRRRELLAGLSVQRRVHWSRGGPIGPEAGPLSILIRWSRDFNPNPNAVMLIQSEASETWWG